MKDGLPTPGVPAEGTPVAGDGLERVDYVPLVPGSPFAWTHQPPPQPELCNERAHCISQSDDCWARWNEGTDLDHDLACCYCGRRLTTDGTEDQ